MTRHERGKPPRLAALAGLRKIRLNDFSRWKSRVLHAVLDDSATADDNRKTNSPPSPLAETRSFPE